MGVKFDVTKLGKSTLFDPQEMGYRDSLDIIKDESVKIQKSFVKIGWYLKHIRDNELYLEDGYADINECAAAQLGYSQSTVSRFINICEKFSKDHNSPELDEKYSGFDKSQMIEMLPLEPEQLEKVTPDMTVKEIRKVKKKGSKTESKEADEKEEADLPGQTSLEEDFPEYLPDPVEADTSDQQKEKTEYATSHKEDTIVEGTYREIQEEKSAYGLVKTEYLEGSMLSEEGCGHKYDCFSCAQDCSIRQKERYCNEAPLGNPFPCATMDVVDKIDDEYALQCQFINHDLAEHTAGSNEPNPCCKRCDQHGCIFRCKRACELSAEIEEQPELPTLKNNDQRKEWLANYKVWGLWYRDENIDVNYYKYDFPDGSRLVVAEYPQRHVYWSGEKEDEAFYHLLEKNKKGYGEPYDEVYRHREECETYLVEFLKNLQKGGQKT